MHQTNVYPYGTDAAMLQKFARIVTALPTRSRIRKNSRKQNTAEKNKIVYNKIERHIY
jgi:hypothetical protein